MIAGEAPTRRCRLYGRAAFVAVLPHLAPKSGRLQRAFDGRADLVEVERLVGEVVRAELHRLDGGLDARVRGQQNHQDVLVELLDLAKDADAVSVRQAVVEEDQVDAFGELFQGGLPGVGFEDFIPFRLQALRQRPANQGFIVDDENSGFWHVCTGGSRPRSAELHRGCRPGVLRLRLFSQVRLNRVGNFSR